MTDIIEIAEKKAKAFKKDYETASELLYSAEAQSDIKYMHRLEKKIKDGEKAYGALSAFEKTKSETDAAKFIFEESQILNADKRRFSVSGSARISGIIKNETEYGRVKHLSGIYKIIGYNGQPTLEKVYIEPEITEYSPLSRQEFIDNVKIEAVRSSGAGGQNVNKVSSCVRAVFVPLNVQAVSQETRSQLMNKQAALERLFEAVDKARREAHAKEAIATRKAIDAIIKKGKINAVINLEKGKIEIGDVEIAVDNRESALALIYFTVTGG